ncbi:hypothetical protein PR202_gb27170 [Eleusine coracana subsp. coracana]|uniref:BED-type domain-containing protein n=1 Tax=Eleusine coracana subsp. coracana TaxID=191504 RepID=A0AAV5FR42_ELECO|nr:hypothetical protein PR202_gb27170 [Eleusine coracana subsp. coracana]
MATLAIEWQGVAGELGSPTSAFKDKPSDSVTDDVRERDVCWEYCDKLEGNKVRCRFCNKVLNGGISRLKFHLSQIPSKGVNPCTKVKEDVIEHVKSIIAAKEEHKEFQLLKKQRVTELSVHPKRPRDVTSQSTSPGPVNSLVVVPTAEQPQFLALEVSAPIPKLSAAANKPKSSSALDAERCIAEFFFENKLDYNVADSISYQNMVEALGGQGFRGPSSEFLRAKWLQKLKSEILQRTKEIEKDWVTTGKELVCSGITKSVSDFLTLQSLLRHRPKLKQMFHSPEYSSSPYANRALSISCVEILEDDELWRAVEEVAAISEPLLRVLRDVSGGKAAIGYIYESMTKVMDSIRTYYIMDEGKYGVYQVLDKVLTTPDQRQDITSQLHAFCKAQGMFSSNIAKEARNNTSPGMWWEQYGDSSPSLQRAAVRITSQVCSTLTFQRDWSIILQSHSEKRNRLDKEALADQTYVHYNLTLHSESKMKKRSDGDPIALAEIDMTSPWVEDSDSPNLTQWLDRFPSALDGGDLNTRQFSGSIFGANDNLFGL